jgi:hypothetical protein
VALHNRRRALLVLAQNLQPELFTGVLTADSGRSSANFTSIDTQKPKAAPCPAAQSTQQKIPLALSIIESESLLYRIKCQTGNNVFVRTFGFDLFALAL